MKSPIPLIHFNNFVLRTPLLPINFFLELTSNNDEISDSVFSEILDNQTILESIYIASPELYEELQKTKRNGNFDVSHGKIKQTLLKYLARMSSRCTPFGLFAGCSVGLISEKQSQIILNDISKYERHTRLDMNFVVALAQNLSSQDHVKSQLYYYPNNSLYTIGKKIRYVEYLHHNGKRQHQVASINNSRYISKVLTYCQEGSTIENSIQQIVSEDVDYEASSEFINSLIDNQIITSSLEPSTTGSEFFEQITNTLSNFENIEATKNTLNQIKSNLKKIDSSFGNEITKYEEVIKLVDDLGVTYDKKHLFQTDMKLNTVKNTINIEIVNQIKRGILLLNKISFSEPNPYIVDFKKSFLEFYGEEEVPLSVALDSEIGIGYGPKRNDNDTNPLIDDISFFKENHSDTNFQTLTYNPFFHQKILNSYIDNEYKIEINLKELAHIEPNWDNLPDTMSTIIQLINIEGSTKIKLDFLSGPSAANLLARFCHSDDKMSEYVKEIVDFERNTNKHKILAEINHLPESRIGNVVMRPNLREYEISYLSGVKSDAQNQININDISIAIKNDRIVLKSMKHQKEIVPRLTNAHNYSKHTIPTYHFLCDMQTEEKRKGIFVDLGNIIDEYKFIPRIEFENIILSEATWNIHKEEMTTIFEAKDKDIKNEALKSFLTKRKIPNLILLAEGDNHLLFNLNNPTSITTFLETIKNRKKFKLIEFLFEEKNYLVKDQKGKNYTNEIILSFHKNTIY